LRLTQRLEDIGSPYESYESSHCSAEQQHRFLAYQLQTNSTNNKCMFETGLINSGNLLAFCTPQGIRGSFKGWGPNSAYEIDFQYTYHKSVRESLLD